MKLVASLERRLWLGVGVLGILVSALALVAVKTIRDLDRSVNRELGLLLETTGLGNGLVTSVTTEIRAAEQYLDQPASAVRNDFIRAGDSAYAFQRRYRDLASLTTSDRYIVNRIGATQARLEVAYGQAHALTDLGRRDEARSLAARTRPAADTLIGDVQALTLAQTNRSLVRAEELQTEAKHRRDLMWLFFFLAVLAAVVVAFSTVRAIKLPLLRLIGAADRFGAGDLRPVKLGAMPEELDRLARAMDDMGSRLRAIVQAVMREASQISASASDFSAMSEELASSSGEISTAMVRIAGSAGQQVGGMREADDLLLRLRRTAESNADAAGRVVLLGDRIRHLAAHHQTDVRAAGDTLLSVREVVRTSAEQVQQLARLSESVTDFIDLIKQISSQTNLLALNAAIEAARAGEHGRGFAVVAEEVRRLADSSAAAAEEVATTVEFIRAQVRDVSATMEHGSARVSGVEGVAAAAARGLEEIAAAVEEVTAAASAVAREASENRRIADELGRKTGAVSQTATEHASMSEEVTAAAEEQSASTEEIASAAANLLQGANRLSALITDFRT
ncbi:MAG TPA: methyl-accepting chemotaxis protein [Gemmatimonadales bacterium]|nr:methyl-accepting chemotaxis protein [Gemmatimonadales bacterium]